MRDIKHRGKSKDTGEWVYGSLVQTKHGFSYIIEYPLTCIPEMAESIEVDSDTVGQYIGLPDSNKKEIYVGDILKSIQYSGQCLTEVAFGQYDYSEYCEHINLDVEHEYERYGFHLINDERLKSGGINTLTYDICQKTSKQYKVCGNSTDNPEMVKHDLCQK